MPTQKEISDFMAQSQERAAQRYRDQFRQEQMEIYKARLKKKVEQKEAEKNAVDENDKK